MGRVGNFNLPLDKIKKLTICPKHRHNLGQYWRPLKTCQHHDHEGWKIALHCKNPVNWQRVQKIQMMFITPVQVGSRWFFSVFLFVCLFCFSNISSPDHAMKQLSQGKTEKETKKNKKQKTKIRVILNILSS